MSDSPKPSAPAGIPNTPVEVEIPAGLFFEAADYTEVNTPLANVEMVRRKVSRHRSKLKAAITLQMDDLGRITAGLHAADRQGNAAPHWYSAVVLLGKLQASVSELAVQIDKAERRYEKSVETVVADAAPEPDAGQASAPGPQSGGVSALIGFEPVSIVPAHPWLTEQATAAMRRKAALAAAEVQR